MAILVFANGEVASAGWLRPFLAQAEQIIAADGGAEHVLAAGAWPNVVVGDLDSLADERRRALEERGTRFVVRPADKDETDLELALLYAAAQEPDEIWLFGTLGGRLDHTVGNLVLLAHPGLGEQRVKVVEPGQEAWLARGESAIEGAAGDVVSLIALGGEARVARTEGLRWPLKDETLAFGPGRGISNEMTAGRALVVVREGLLLCVHVRRDGVMT